MPTNQDIPSISYINVGRLLVEQEEPEYMNKSSILSNSKKNMSIQEKGLFLLIDIFNIIQSINDTEIIENYIEA